MVAVHAVFFWPLELVATDVVDRIDDSREDESGRAYGVDCWRRGDSTREPCRTTPICLLTASVRPTGTGEGVGGILALAGRSISTVQIGVDDDFRFHARR